MKLDCVLTATNDNPLYMECIPIFVDTWHKLFPELDVKVVLIADKIPEEYGEYSSSIVLFHPIEDVSTSFTSQYIRSIYPALLQCEHGVLITDIDMLPMNRDFYINHIEDLSNDTFIVYHPERLHDKELTMCYNIATPTTWGNVFKVKNEQDLINHMKTRYKQIEYDGLHGGQGWGTDQLELYKHVMEWDKLTKKLHILNDKKTGYRRLCRDRHHCIHPQLENDIKNLKFTDYHIHRPYHKFKDFVDYIVNLLPEHGIVHTRNQGTIGK